MIDEPEPRRDTLAEDRPGAIAAARAFRFYVRRGDDPWMSDDLEGFDQPVAVIRAS
jgi:hypothetical protein